MPILLTSGLIVKYFKLWDSLFLSHHTVQALDRPAVNDTSLTIYFIHISPVICRGFNDFRSPSHILIWCCVAAGQVSPHKCNLIILSDWWWGTVGDETGSGTCQCWDDPRRIILVIQLCVYLKLWWSPSRFWSANRFRSKWRRRRKNLRARAHRQTAQETLKRILNSFLTFHSTDRPTSGRPYHEHKCRIRFCGSASMNVWKAMGLF